jgi:hypothetical protein
MVMETARPDVISTISIQLEKLRRYLLTVYLEVGKDIDETMSKLGRQITKLDIKIKDMDLDLLKYKILSSIMEEAGMTKLLNQLDAWKEEEIKIAGTSKLTKVASLLSLDDCRDIRHYLSKIEEAVEELKSA